MFLAREPSLAGDKQPATAERIPWIASEGSESMASWFDFLRIEAGIAMSFIDSARLHSNPANSARSVVVAGALTGVILGYVACALVLCRLAG